MSDFGEVGEPFVVLSSCLRDISMPAMGVENERVFSDTKLFISDSRNRLGPEIIEVLGCIRKWN
jgi:hypothetical protein